jgi:multidrug efflux pump subunit AcrA (membrane-fusion protein)
MPFQGVVTQWHARPGQRVKAGDVLARCRLAPEAAIQLRRRLSAPHLKDLETQIAVFEKQMEQLRVKHRELQLLAQQNMATTDSVAQIEREIQLLNRQRTILQERLGVEKGLVQDDQAAMRKLLGHVGPSGQIPDEVPLSAPISGLVIWVNPDVRENAELGPGAVVAVVGVTNPMRVRTLVHEIEAAKLKVGDPGELTLESLPGQKFPAKLVQMQWTSSTPALGDPSYYEVEFEVANPDGVLREGLKASVLLRTGR